MKLLEISSTASAEAETNCRSTRGAHVLGRFSKVLPVVVLGVALRTLATMVLTKSTASFLGPQEFARYGHYLMLASYLLTASSLGLGNAMAVYLVKRLHEFDISSEQTESEVDALCSIGGLSGVLVACSLGALLVLGTGSGFLPHITLGSYPFWFSFCAVVGMGTSFQSALLAQQKHGRYQTISTLIPILSCTALFSVGYFGVVNAETAIRCYMAGFAVPVLWFVIGRRSLPAMRVFPARPIIRFLFPYVLPSLLVPTVGTIGILAVRRSLAANTTEYDLGLWQALWRLSEAYMGVLFSIGTAVFIPRLSHARSSRAAREELIKASVMLLGLYLPIALSWIVSPRLVLSLLLSPKFADIAHLLPIQVVGDVLKLLCFVQVLAFTAYLRPKLALLSEACLGLAFFGLTWLLAPRLHSTGAVLAYALSYVLLLLILLPFTVRCTRNLGLNEIDSTPQDLAPELIAASRGI